VTSAWVKLTAGAVTLLVGCTLFAANLVEGEVVLVPVPFVFLGLFQVAWGIRLLAATRPPATA